MITFTDEERAMEDFEEYQDWCYGMYDGYWHDVTKNLIKICETEIKEMSNKTVSEFIEHLDSNCPKTNSIDICPIYDKEWYCSDDPEDSNYKIASCEECWVRYCSMDFDTMLEHIYEFVLPYLIEMEDYEDMLDCLKEEQEEVNEILANGEYPQGEY